MRATMFYRLAGIAGLLSALVLVSNASRRAELLPANLFTRGIAPLTECFGLLALTGFYLVQRKQVGVLGMAGYALNTMGLAATMGIDVAGNYIFPYLDPDTVTTLLQGTTGTMFLIMSVMFLLGVLLFGAATLRARQLPAWAMGLYIVGLIPVSLRTVVPPTAATVGLLVTAIGSAWLATALLSAATNDRAADPVAA